MVPHTLCCWDGQSNEKTLCGRRKERCSIWSSTALMRICVAWDLRLFGFASKYTWFVRSSNEQNLDTVVTSRLCVFAECVYPRKET